MRQVEVSRTVVFDAPRHARGFFEAWCTDNLDIGRPEEMQLIFGRRVRTAPIEGYRTRLLRAGEAHRTQAHVEDRMKQFKACGARNLPSIDYDRNAAWLQLAALATTLTAWLRHIGLDADLATATTKTLRFRLLSAPARLVTHARRRILKIPPGWACSADLATAWDRLQALHPI
jgi:hypothetical protein